MSAGAAAEYTAKQNLLNKATSDGVRLAPEHVAAVEGASKALGDQTQRLNDLQEGAKAADAESKKLIKTQEAFDKQISRGLENALTGFITDLAEGVSLAEALARAMNSVADMMIKAGSQQIVNSLQQAIGAVGTMIGGSAGGAVAGVAAVGIGMLIKSFTRTDEAAKKAAEALEQARAAWAGMKDELDAFLLTAAGLKNSDLANQLLQFKKALSNS
jgi:hypothetical protein